MERSMRYRLAFTSWVACGSSATSEIDTLIRAETLSKPSGPGSKLAVLKKRVGKSGQRLPLICRSAGIAVLALMIGHLALAQAGSPSSANEPTPDRLTIVNPHHYDVSEERVRVLFLTTCRVV